MSDRAHASSVRCRPAPPGACIEALEPRVVLSTYTVVDTAEAFNLDDLIRTVAPAAGTVVENFGYNVAPLGDVNADGRPDFAVAAPGRLPDPIGRWGGPDAGQGPAGRVFIYSGADLSVIRELTDQTAGFGAAMVAVGDLDADGVSDLVVGSPSYDSNPDAAVDHFGRVVVYSGRTGDGIQILSGAGRFFEFGFSLANVGDFDGDGFDDVIVGAPGAGVDPAALGPGCAFVYSLVDATLLLTFTGEAVGDRFGHAVAGGADVPLDRFGAGDGVKDFAVGAPGYDGAGADSGRAYVYDGQTGQQFLHSPLGDGLPAAGPEGDAQDILPQAGDRFGSSLVFLGARADGSPTGNDLRLLVGAPGGDLPPGGQGAPRTDAGYAVASRVTQNFGATLMAFSDNTDFGFTEGDRLGERMTLVRDIVGDDGLSEVAILAPGNTTGRRLVIGNGNYSNFIATGLTNVGRYSSVAVVGDLDNDGVNDFVFGEADDATPVRVKAVPIPLAADLSLRAVSDDASYVVLTATLGPVNAGSQAGYVFRDARRTSLAAAGLDGLTVRAVNNAGLFYADLIVDGVDTDQYIVFEGVRTRLADAITTTVGPAPTSRLSLQSMSNTGDLVFHAGNAAYLFRAGVLRFLWQGRVGHVNDSGVVVGIAPEDIPGVGSAGVPGTGPVRMLTADGQVRDIPTLRSTGIGRFINNAGQIVAHTADGTLVRWTDGVTETLAALAPLGLPGVFLNWTVDDVDEAGRVAARVVTNPNPPGGPPPSALGSYNYFFEPGLGLRPTGLVISDPLALPPPDGNGPSIARLIDGNALLVGDQFAVPIPQSGPVTSAPDRPINVTWTDRGLDVAASTVGGQGVVLRLSGQQAGLWIGAPLGIAAPDVFPPPIVPEVALYTDPRDGRSYAIARLATQLVWFTQTFEGVYDEGRVLPTSQAITSNLAVFASADGRVHLAGYAADGDIIMLFQLNRPEFAPGDLGNWGSVNLSTEHLNPQGQATPGFVSNLTAYVTPWNGLNIAGLDEQGRVHTVWWAPGLTLWQTSDLSSIAGASAMRGNVTSYVTGWSGLNVAGTTTDGEVVALWWVPEFGGQWRFDPLLPETPRGLREGTLSAYVTPWSGLNIAGINPDTGAVAVYWWTPTTPWAYDVLPVAGGSPVLDGPLTTIATPPGQIDIFARTGDNAILRFFWNPGDGATWNVDNVGARAI